jgi:hypothetical protein
MLRAMLAGLLLAGCVATVRQSPTSSEAAAGPPPPPSEERTAGQLVAKTPPAPGHADEPDREARPGEVWVRGYWHWRARGWVWVPGRFEQR